MRRRTRTGLTVVGLGLALGAIVFMLAFSSSLAKAVRNTGDPDNIIILSKRAQTHVLSSIAAQECGQIRNKLRDYAATFVGEGGRTEPLISLEVYIGLTVATRGVAASAAGRQRAVLHGVDPEVALRANRLVRLTAGRLPDPEKLEVMCGSTAADRIGVPASDLKLESSITLLNREWTVVGLFEAPGTLMESEIWADVETLRRHLKRQDYSFIRVKLEDPELMATVVKTISTDEQFSVKAFPEQVYFADYAEGFYYFRQFAHLLTALILAGGVIAGMNTMYTAVMGRVREIGTLQVIGFSKASVLIGILTESVLLALAGGVLGCGLGLLADGLSVKIPMAAIRIHVDVFVLLGTMLLAVGIGICGAFVPAYRALKLRMVDAVRYE